MRPATLAVLTVVVWAPPTLAQTHALTLGKAGDETVLLDGGKPVWQGRLGPQDRDGEWRRDLDLDAGGAVLYEQRADVNRCDGVPVRIHPQRWDFAGGRFQPAGDPPTVPQGAAVLPALRGQANAPAGLTAKTAPSAFRFQAASSQAGDGDSAEGLSAPRELDDGDPSTAWRAGVPGAARGEVLTARSQTSSARALALRILPGDSSADKAFRAGNRLKKLIIVLPAKAYLVDFARDPALEAGGPREPYWVVLPEPAATSCVTVVVVNVYPGSRDRTAIAELAVLTDLDAGGPAALAGLAEAVARGGSGAADAEHHLAGQAAAGAAALVTAAAATGRPADGRRRLRQALARLGDPAGAAEVAAGLREAEDEPELARYAEGLAHMGDAAAPTLIALLADEAAPERARRAAARVLGGAPDPAARAALEAACGRGPREVRGAVTLALGGRAPEELPVALAAARAAGSGEPGREADLWRVVGLLARRARGDVRREAASAVGERLAGAPAYELRCRLVQAAAALSEEPAAHDALARVLTADPEPAVRQLAVEELATGGSAAPPKGDSDLLVRALDDPDPGVRAAALPGLHGGPALDAPIVKRLREDSWPLIRRAAADALAARCPRPAPADALYAAGRGDTDETVRRAALAALVRCREPRAGGVLLALAGDRSASGSLRAYAASLLGPLGDRAHVPALVGLLKAALEEAYSSEDGLRVAAAAAHALGELGDARAAPALLAAAKNADFPVVQAAALGALAGMCPAGAPEVIAQAARSEDALVKGAARVAGKRCPARPK